jgi:hypothetical protein
MKIILTNEIVILLQPYVKNNKYTKQTCPL